MGGLTRTEQDAIARCARCADAATRCMAWAAVNSGSRQSRRAGERSPAMLADAFAALPGAVALEDAGAGRRHGRGRTLAPVAHGRNLHLTVRPEAPVQLLLTGHMDTVFGADHPVPAGLPGSTERRARRPRRRRHEGRHRGHARRAEGGGGAPAAPRLGYEVVINSRRGGRLARLGRADRAGRARQAGGAHLRALGAARRHAGRRAAGQRQFLDHGRRAAAPMPGAIREDGRNAVLAAADLALRLAAPKRPGLSRQSGPDRRRRAQQCRSRPCRAARQPAPARRPTDQAARRALLDDAIAAVAAAHEVRDPPPRRLRPPAQAARCRAPSGCSRWCARCGADLGQAIGWRADRRCLRRQQHRRLRRAGGRYDGRARRRDPFGRGISDRREPGRTRAPVGADAAAPRRGRRAVSFRVAPGARRGFRGDLRDGQADRRRLHQPARRHGTRWSPSWRVRTPPSRSDARTRRATTLRPGAGKCRDRAGARHLPDLLPGRQRLALLFLPASAR